MRVYEDAVGGWVFFDDVAKHHFKTEQEAMRFMKMQEQKLAKARAVQEWAVRLAMLDDFLTVVNAQGFGYDHVNEPTDDDLIELGITRDDYRNGISLLIKLWNVIEGVAVTVTDHRPVIARLRTDV